MHAYSWSGPRAEFDQEYPRRPENPPFDAAETPPLQVAHWLRKPRRLVRATFTDPEAATAWLVERAAECGARLQPPPEVRRRYARDALRHGSDVAWGCYLPGQRYLSLALVVCPNRADPAAGCPAPPDPAPFGNGGALG